MLSNRDLAGRRIPPPILIVGAITMAVVGAAILFMSSTGAESETASPFSTGQLAQGAPAVSLRVTAQEASTIRVIADGRTKFDGTLHLGETREWEASSRVELWSNNAQEVIVTVNGHVLGSLAAASTDPSWTVVQWGWGAGWGAVVAHEYPVG